MKYSYAIINSNTRTMLQIREFIAQFEDMKCVAMASSVNDTQNTVLNHLPDLLILDVDSNPNEVFFNVCELYQYLDHLPKIIAVSKDSQKAYKALKSGFFDYWLLPLNELELKKTLFKFKKQVAKPVPTTICLKSYKDYHYLNTDDILYLKADNNATDFFMQDGRKISAYKTLKSFEQKLPANFIRVHQSYIINSNYVSRINYGKSICTLKNNDGSGLPFSKSYKEKIDELKALLSKNSISTLS